VKASEITVGEAYYHARGVNWQDGRGFSVGRFTPTSEPHHGKVTGTLAYDGDYAGQDVSVFTARTGDLRGPYAEVADDQAARAVERHRVAEQRNRTAAEREVADDARAARLTGLGVEFQRDTSSVNRGRIIVTREGLDRLLDLAGAAQA
jgi:hypothetical protein